MLFLLILIILFLVILIITIFIGCFCYYQFWSIQNFSVPLVENESFRRLWVGRHTPALRRQARHKNIWLTELPASKNLIGQEPDSKSIWLTFNLWLVTHMYKLVLFHMTFPSVEGINWKYMNQIWCDWDFIDFWHYNRFWI